MINKIFYVILFLPTLVFSSVVIHSLSSVQPEISVVAGQSVTKFKGTGSYGNPGQPELPFYTLTFLVPANADLQSVSVTIENMAEELLPGEYLIKPALPPTSDGNLIWPNDKNIVNGKDMQIYGMNAFFPNSYVKITSVGQMREFKLVEVTITPFKYNPVTGSLIKIIDGMVQVQFDELTGVSTIKVNSTDNLDRRLQKLTVNYDKRHSLGYSELTRREKRAQNYFILTTSKIQSASQSLQTFIEAKKRRGFGVKVITESEWGGGKGNTAADNLRKWLKANYQAQNIDYVLLIGDPHPITGDLAMKNCKPTFMEVPTDFYFAELSGDWDKSGNGIYGEFSDVGSGGADKYGELHLGRIPVYDNEAASLDKILTKICTYEQMSGSSLQWRTKALLIAKPYDDKTPLSDLYEEVRNKFVTPNKWNCFRIYDDNFGNPEVSQCTEENVLEAWTTKQFGYVNWATHGSETGAKHILQSSSTKELNDSYPSIVWQGSCTNAHPETKNNLSYSLLQNGALAAMGATRPSIYSIGEKEFEGNGANQGLIYHFSKNIIQDSCPVGDALNRTREETSVTAQQFLWINCLCFNAYGCPAVGIYTYGNSTPIIEKMIGGANLDLEFYNKTIHFHLHQNKARHPVSIELFTVQGRLVTRLFTGNLAAGRHIVPLSNNQQRGFSLASGLYICVLKTGKISKKINVLITHDNFHDM